jgi:type II secretory pathway component GspD/PulD (secretin)
VRAERTGENLQVTTVEEKTGVVLEVTPHTIGSDAAILHLKAWLRVAQPHPREDAVPGALVLRERTVETTVPVRDGETLLLGGLRLRRTVGARRGLPLVESVPLADVALSARTSECEDTEIVVLVRACIVVPGRGSGLFVPPGERRRLDEAVDRRLETRTAPRFAPPTLGDARARGRSPAGTAPTAPDGIR